MTHPLEGPSESSFLPPEPKTVEDTGLRLGFLSDLALKILYFRGYVAGADLAEQMRLPFPGVMERVLEFLKREMLCEVRGAGGFGQSSFEWTITAKGIARAREILDRSQYVGPAPVPLYDYSEGIRRQPMLTESIREQSIRNALRHLVVDEEMIQMLGPAINSGRSVFLYGEPGNGKTAMAESVGRMILGSEMYIPYAIEVGGMVIKVFDEVNHLPVQEPAQGNGANTAVGRRRVDQRWVRVKRPVITTGGELTLETLDLNSSTY